MYLGKLECVRVTLVGIYFPAGEIKLSPSESPLMKKKNSLKEQDEAKAALSSSSAAAGSPVPEAAPVVHRAPAEERVVSFNLGDLEEVPERERLSRVEMKEISLDNGEWPRQGRGPGWDRVPSDIHTC